MNTDLSIFLSIELVLFVLTVFLCSIRLQPNNITRFELKRRVTRKDEGSKLELRRYKDLTDLMTLRYIKYTVLVVIVVVYTVGYLDWLYGLLVSIGMILLANSIARFGFIANLSHKIYNKYEVKILSAVEKLHVGLNFLRTSQTQPVKEFTLHSKEELLYLIDNAGDVINHSQRQLLVHAMKFASRPVKDVMTARSKIYSIDKKELLGPLVLDDLHKASHASIPVIHRNIDHVVGVLHVQDLLTIDNNRSVTVEKAMQKNVYYIHQDDSLEDALRAFLHTSSSLLIVVDESKKTVGLIKLSDIIQSLVGQKLKSEFDHYDSLDAVANRTEIDT